MRSLPIAFLVALATLALPGCGEQGADAQTVTVAAPIELEGTGYALATKEALPERKPEDSEGLHQVFQLSKNIISGAEPTGEAAFKRIADMGVKTILSVDGKTPDAETARKYGLRYVHVPIKYSGITTDEIDKIAKTYRELEGPFFVHCFHGKHRGPAGAAIGRLVLDGASREQALAEMAQWCGTAQKYEGLFQTIAKAEMPTAAQSKASSFAFDEAHPFEGIRSGMILLTRAWDNIKYLEKGDFKPNAEHPDLDAVNEAEKAKQLLAQMHASDEMLSKPKDYQDWMKDSAEGAVALHQSLYKLKEGQADALATARKHFTTVKQACSACHKAYRNNDD